MSEILTPAMRVNPFTGGMRRMELYRNLTFRGTSAEEELVMIINIGWTIQHELQCVR